MRPRLAIVLLAALTLRALPAAAEESLRFLPFDDAVYLLLDRAYARGWLGYLPHARPYSVSDAVLYLREIDAYLADRPDTATPLATEQVAYHLERLAGAERHPLAMDWGEDNHATADFPIAFEADTRVNDPRDTFLGLMPGVEVRGAVSDRLYMGMNITFGAALATWQIAPFGAYAFPVQEDYPVYDANLTTGTAGFGKVDQLGSGHTPGDVDLFARANILSQNTVNFGLGTLTLGRGVFDWGPSTVGNLQLSSQSKAYDYLHLQIPLGRGATFSWLTGFLQDFTGTGLRQFEEKILNTHRLEVQLTPWFNLSIYEAIVYSRRFELSYLNPLQLYAVSEISQGDLDNKFYGMDFVFRVAPVKFYLSAFVDDWDLGALVNPLYYHNEFGGIAGVEVYDLIPNLGLTLEYTRLSHWMYTHRADLSDEAHNLNRYVHAGAHLGHFLNPNSHMIHLGATYGVTPTLGLTSAARFIQNGGGGYENDGEPYDRGDIFTPPDWSWEQDHPDLYPNNIFLDGIVESVFSWETGVDFRLPEQRIHLTGSYTLQYTANVDKVEGVNRWDHLLSLGATWMLD